MKTTLITLAMLSLILAGCVVEPGRGYGDRGYGGRGYGENGWHNGDRADYRPVYGQQSYWNR